MSNDELLKFLRLSGERSSADGSGLRICDEAADLIEKQSRRISELECARIAYASEFAPNADGEPDVGNIHANIRAMKAELFEAGDEVEKLERALADCRDACGEIARMDDDLLVAAVGDPFSVPAFVAEAIRLLNADNAALMEDAAAQIEIARDAIERAAGLERDAARFDWLLDNINTHRLYRSKRAWFCAPLASQDWTEGCATPREAIDVAMAKTQEGV